LKLSLITSLFVLLAGAYALGRVCVRLKQPPIAGHMIAGIFLGPSVLSWVEPSPQLGAISDIAVLMVVLTAGLEMRLQEVLTNLVGRAAAISLLGFALPAAAGAIVAAAFSLPTIPILVVAMCIAVTALPVALQILAIFSLLRSRIATISISGALLSDLLVFAILGVLIELATANRLQSLGISIAYAAARMLGLIAIVAISHFACRRLMRGMPQNVKAADATSVNLVSALLFVLALAGASELLGFHFAIGAFFAAMMITPEVVGARSFERLSATCTTLTSAVFGPLFLAYQGMQFGARSLSQPGFLVALISAAVVAKLVGGYCVGRLQKLSRHDAWGVGIVMNARGVMELVVASIAYHAGLIDEAIFSALLLVGLVTTALTPLMLQRWRATRPLPETETSESPRSP
jgi:Kef-type K+ transport system membrane component KefB